MNKSVDYILAALNDEVIDIKDESHWEEILDVALEHRLHCLVVDHYDKQWSHEYKATNEYSEWKNFTRSIMIDQLTKNHNASQMLKSLNLAGIQYIVMKGNDINQYYKNPKVRLMGDMDILIHQGDIDKVSKVFIEQGYIHNVDKDTEKEIAFEKNKSFDFEVHFKLFKDVNFGDTKWMEDLIWKDKRKQGYNDFYVMEANIGLVYLLAHMCKHIRGSGIGLKALYDIAKYTQGNQEYMKMDLLISYLKRLNIYCLSMNIFECCNRYLNLGLVLDYNFEDVKVRELFDFLVRSGNFGETEELVFEKRYSELSKNDNKEISRWKFVFLPLEEMRKRYKLLIKYPKLLPVLWGYRSISVLITKRQSFKAFASNKVSQVKIEERRYLINEMFKDK